MKFLIKTFGCQMNVNDSEKIKHILTHRGIDHCEDEEQADIIIINSCAVREKAQDKIFSYLGRLPREKKIIVAGCVAQSEKQKIISRDRKVDFVVGTHQFYKIDSIVDKILTDDHPKVLTEFSRQWEEVCPDIQSRESPVSGFISIMEGCDNFCSYCIVPFTRGREKHRPFEKIMEEAKYLAEKGYQEIILLGQNVNNWRDKKNNLEFPGLLQNLAAEIEVRWIRFITSYPGYFDENLIEVMIHNKKIARHIHFPIQSGSTRLLKKMNRNYSRGDYLKIITKFREKIPGMKFSTDFIVGFPSESENDFNLTLSLIEKVEYESVFSFIYSPRNFTSARSFKDNVNPEKKKQRLYELQKTQEKIQLRNNKKMINKKIEVLVTQKNPKKKDEVIGRTESYRVVNFKSRADIGEFKTVLVEGVGPHSLRGKELK